MRSNLVRWTPIREMANMQNVMDRIFDETWRPFFEQGELNVNTLALDIHEDDQNYTVITELPGVKAENINVKMDGGYLTIEGEIPEHTVDQESTQMLLQERRYGSFSRRVRLPKQVDTDKVDAQYTDGVLTLTLPKAEEVKPKAIPIKVGK